MGKNDKTKDVVLKTLIVVDEAISASAGLAEFVGNFVALGIKALLGKDFIEKKDVE